MIYCDTSALVKLFQDEEGSELVLTLVDENRGDLWMLELVSLEFKSALYRRFRCHDLNEQQLQSAVSGFDEQISSFHIEPLTRDVMHEAEALLAAYGMSYGLRTLDALHLGAYSLLADVESVFVAADNNLCRVAEVAGYTIINPLSRR